MHTHTHSSSPLILPTFSLALLSLLGLLLSFSCVIKVAGVGGKEVWRYFRTFPVSGADRGRLLAGRGESDASPRLRPGRRLSDHRHRRRRRQLLSDSGAPARGLRRPLVVVVVSALAAAETGAGEGRSVEWRRAPTRPFHWLEPQLRLLARSSECEISARHQGAKDSLGLRSIR